MSINPEDINAFAGMLGKLNKIQEGKHSPKTAEEHQKAIADNDMHAILHAFHNTSGITKSALQLVEDKDVPDYLKPGYKPKQLPADYEMPHVDVLNNPDTPKNPTQGYLVGSREPGDEESWDGVSPDTDMTLSGRTDPTPMGLEKPEGEEEVEEAKVDNPYAIGMAQAMKSTGDKPPLKKSTITKAHDIAKAIQKDESVDSFAKSLEEQLANFKEDKISKDKKKLSDYIGDKMSAEEVIKTIKTVTTDDGKEMKIYGNEDDGFRIRVNNKDSKNVFDSYEEAVMACEMFVARNKNTDYVDEK